jgi:hypothetical protein
LLVQSIIHIPLVLVVSSLFFVMFERPFMDKDFFKRISQKFKQSNNN